MYTLTKDTIVAVSSAPGHAARGLVRCSGPLSIGIGAEIFRSNTGAPLTEAVTSTAHQGELIFDDRHRVPAISYLFRAPHSYTRQDVLELHTVGSPAVLDLVVDRCVAGGARPAEPGEFTARALLSGAMSLTQAEAVAAVIQARSDHQLRAARTMMTGRLGKRIDAWREELADLLSLVVADIDFAEEPIEFITADVLIARLGELRAALAQMLADDDSGQRFDVLPHVLLLGPPNAGKSTLLNALSKMDRAIASTVAGTTRDILSAPVRLPGVEVVMLDAAGIDDNPDEVLARGRELAIKAAASVDLVCLVFDANRPAAADVVTRLAALASAPAVVVGAKLDALDESNVRRRRTELEAAGAGPVCMVSALTGQHLDKLRLLLAESLGAGGESTDDVSIALTSRQRRALNDASLALERCSGRASDHTEVLDSAELIAVELGEALAALSGLTGPITAEDLLGRVFAAFCIGK